MSRHTQPMTDAYMTGQRLRNAARTKSKIEQLGDRWLLHPDNAVTRDQHLELRRSRSERIDLRSIRSVPIDVSAEDLLDLESREGLLMRPRTYRFDLSLARAAFLSHAAAVFDSGLLIHHEGGAQ